MNNKTWRIRPMAGGSGTISHSWVTVAPECPDDRHPQRWCACKVHRTRAAAETYVAEQKEAA